MRRILLASITAALIEVAILAASLRPSDGATPDVITEWSVAASKAATASEMAPLRTPITFALLHLAMYDAVTAIVGDRRRLSVNPPVTRPASAQAAAIEAGYCVLVAEFPTQVAALDTVTQTSWPSSLTRRQRATASQSGLPLCSSFWPRGLMMAETLSLHTRQTPGPGSGCRRPLRFFRRPRRFSRRSRRLRCRARRSFVRRPSRARFEALGRRL